MHPREVFETNLSVIERVIERVCRAARLDSADAEDFASCARLHLIENDYDVLRRYDGSAALATYLTVVVQRLLINVRNHELGRWRPSIEAQRMGAAGVLLERLVGRDRRPLAEVVPIVLAADRTLTAQDVASMAERLPERSQRPRPVDLGEVVERTVPSTEDAAMRIDEAERRYLAQRTETALRGALAAMSVEDRMILKMRFGSSMAISDIARILRLPQRPLYRRIESLLARLRAALAREGIGSREADELIGANDSSLDAGIADAGVDVENGDGGQSIDRAGSPMGGQP
jgi:RNA polymerase sigma factor for flagellar operon FliA